MLTPADLVRNAGLPRHEAERLLVLASGRPKAQLLTFGPLDAGALERFEELVAQRRAGMPLQYLEGSVQFGPLELTADSRALIPRPETERLWERVVAELGRAEPRVIVDLCTGSGNLALALKHRYPDASVYGTDISIDAVSLAAQNGLSTRLDVTWLHGDLFAPLADELRRCVDVVVANPPYIAAGDWDGLPGEVRDHEPLEALVAGPTGLEVLERIAQEAGEWLRPGGLVACEIGADQGDQACRLFGGLGGSIESDLTGRDRFVFGRSPVG